MTDGGYGPWRHAVLDKRRPLPQLAKVIGQFYIRPANSLTKYRAELYAMSEVVTKGLLLSSHSAWTILWPPTYLAH